MPKILQKHLRTIYVTKQLPFHELKKTAVILDAILDFSKPLKGLVYGMSGILIPC